MQPRAVTLLLLAACGDNRLVRDDAPVIDATETCVVAGDNVQLRQIATGCRAMGAPAFPGCLRDTTVLVTSPPDDARLFALERDGGIRILKDEVLQPAYFLDLSVDANGPVLTDGNEMGLLGLAFHPQYATNGQLFVFYTARNPNLLDAEHPYLNVVARYTVDPTDPDRADPQSGVVILAIADPFTNHNGGMIEFGNDGLLYVSTGDGGHGGDPFGHAQNPSSLLGKILRIDVDRSEGTRAYSIPIDNPFASGTDGAPEVFVLGMRNPWRWSFDRATGDMWIGDVGQEQAEELNLLRAGQQAGKNLGWNMYEGNFCYAPPCDPVGMTFPFDERNRTPTPWWSIIGGQVYRGSCFPDLVGWYFYTDCGNGRLVKARIGSDGSRTVVDLPDSTYIAYPTSLHADSRGELYETNLEGSIFRLEVAP